jgi:predicted tellurium resistance membrane protein TerC
MIGTTLIADGFGFHVPKGYIYSAMAFSALVEGLNMLARRRSQRPYSRRQQARNKVEGKACAVRSAGTSTPR